MLVARPCEMTSLIRWVCDRYYADTPTDCPVVQDTIRHKITTLLQTYFVRDQGEIEDFIDTALQDILQAIDDELSQLVHTLTQKGFHIHTVETFALDGSTRFLIKMFTGDAHDQSLPEADTG